MPVEGSSQLRFVIVWCFRASGCNVISSIKAFLSVTIFSFSGTSSNLISLQHFCLNSHGWSNGRMGFRLYKVGIKWSCLYRFFSSGREETLPVSVTILENEDGAAFVNEGGGNDWIFLYVLHRTRQRILQFHRLQWLSKEYPTIRALHFKLREYFLLRHVDEIIFKPHIHLLFHTTINVVHSTTNSTIGVDYNAHPSWYLLRFCANNRSFISVLNRLKR